MSYWSQNSRANCWKRQTNMIYFFLNSEKKFLEKFNKVEWFMNPQTGNKLFSVEDLLKTDLKLVPREMKNR